MQYRLQLVAAIALSTGAAVSCTDRSFSRVAFASPDLGDEALRAANVPNRVVIVTLDGVRAEDVFDGADPRIPTDANITTLMTPEALMPRTYRLVRTRGVALGVSRPRCGRVRTAGGANVSLPGYFEIFTGKPTTCRDNECSRTQEPTWLDDAANAGMSAASIGSWEVLARAVSNGESDVLVAAGRHPWPRSVEWAGLEHLVASGERSASFPGNGEYRPDAHTGAIALEYLRREAPDVLHVGLGDTDEWGHRGDYAAYLEAIRQADAFIGALADTLAASGDRGARTTVLVTTDHGRDPDFRHHGPATPSSSRSFVIAFGGRVPARGVVCPSRDLTLLDVAATARALVDLPLDPSPEAGRPIEEITGSVAIAKAGHGRAARLSRP